MEFIDKIEIGVIIMEKIYGGFFKFIKIRVIIWLSNFFVGINKNEMKLFFCKDICILVFICSSVYNKSWYGCSLSKMVMNELGYMVRCFIQEFLGV